MHKTKERILRFMEARARQRARHLARQLARSPSEEKEGILAALEHERWFADSCREVLDHR
jgi:hypothetical protein